MTIRGVITKLSQDEWLNFIVTNGLPRRFAGRCVRWISRSENRWVSAVALAAWNYFAVIELADAEQTRFRSMHACFTRRLRPGARPIDPDPAVLSSPCDAIVGACGPIAEGRALQVKGMDYALAELLDSTEDAAGLEGGQYMTLRLTSGMYHRFHAPYDCRVDHVRHIFGDCWNVNPPTLRRVRRLFCRNERVVIHSVLSGREQPVILVAVAAILVSGIRLGFLPPLPIQGRRPVRRDTSCSVAFRKGAEMGWFEHGSTLIVLVPKGVRVAAAVQEGDRIRMGQRLLRLPA